MNLQRPCLWPALAAGLVALGPGAPARRARGAERPAEVLRAPHRLLLLPAPAGAVPTPRLDTAEIARSLGVFLLAHRVETRLDDAPLPSGFPEQVRAARARGAHHHALAVVWFQLVPLPGRPGAAELYLHLLDRVTDKAVVKTLKLSGQVTPDFYRAVALKILSLLRAALLEVEATQRSGAPLWRLLGPDSASGAARRRPRAPSPRHPQVHLGVGYRLGFFGTSQWVHHGVGADLGVALYRWLELAADVVVPQPFGTDHPLASLAVTPYRVALTARLGWRWGPVTLQGEAGASLMALAVRRTAPPAPAWHRLGWDPGGRLGARVVWSPLPRLGVVAQAGVDLLGRRQRVRSGDTILLTLPWAAPSVGLALRVTLH